MTNSKVKEKDIKLENSMPVKGWFDHFRKRFGLYRRLPTIAVSDDIKSQEDAGNILNTQKYREI